MKLISKRTLNKMIEEAVLEVEREAYRKGQKQGYSEGLHVGLTSDKEGIHMNVNGIYSFKEGTSKAVINKINFD